MKLYGITGGIGMGKSAIGTLLEAKGVKVIDTDLIARNLTGPGQPALEEIAAAFGAHLIGADGALDRQELARLVFPNSGARRRLEGILHPRIRRIWQDQVAEWRSGGIAECAVIIPLLFETQAQAVFDAVVCVACGVASQWTRLRFRGWTDAGIRQRIESQWPVDKKMSLAGFVVWTDAPLEEADAQLDKIRACLR